MNAFETGKLTPDEQRTVAGFFSQMQQIRMELQKTDKIVWNIVDFDTNKHEDRLILATVTGVNHPCILGPAGFTITDLDLKTPDNQQIITQCILRGKKPDDFTAIVKDLSNKCAHATSDIEKTMFSGLLTRVKSIGNGVHQMNWD